MKGCRRVFAAALLFLVTGPVQAVDGLLLDAGEGASGIEPNNEGTATRFGLVWDWPWRRNFIGTWGFSGQWELTAGTLVEDNEDEAPITEVVEGGLVAMLRLAHYRTGSGGSYLEVGSGPHYLSDKQLDSVRLSTHFQFQTIAGAGQRFGRNGRFELGYRFMHLSNAGIDQPNPGLNYHMLHLTYRF